jgi:hypothetical protein
MLPKVHHDHDAAIPSQMKKTSVHDKMVRTMAAAHFAK